MADHCRRRWTPPDRGVTQEEWDALFEWARRIRADARLARARAQAFRGEWIVAPEERSEPVETARENRSVSVWSRPGGNGKH